MSNTEIYVSSRAFLFLVNVCLPLDSELILSKNCVKVQISTLLRKTVGGMETDEMSGIMRGVESSLLVCLAKRLKFWS